MAALPQLPERVREEMDSSAEFFRRMGVDRVEKRNGMFGANWVP